MGAGGLALKSRLKGRRQGNGGVFLRKATISHRNGHV